MRRWTDFLGRRAVRLLAAGTLSGLALFAAEAAFAYGLQAFLASLGVLGEGMVRLPAWAPSGRGTIVFLVAVGALRGLLVGAQTAMQGAANAEFKHANRSRILRWALLSESTSLSEATNLFAGRVEAAGSVVAGAQILSLQLPLAALLVGMLVWISLPLTGAILASMALLVPFMRWVSSRIKRSGDALDRAWESTNRQLVVGIKNLLLLRIYGTQEEEERRGQAGLESYRRHMLSYFFLTGSSFALPQVLGVLSLCLAAAWAQRGQRVPAGALVSFFYLMLRLVQCYTAGGQAVASIQLYWPQFRQVRDWWERQESAPSPARPPAATPFSELIGWRLRGVGFRYESPVLAALDLDVAPGSALVLQGASGSGKSTLLSLLIGMLAPAEGTIELLVGGERLPLEEARARLLGAIGYVGPDCLLIEGTLRQNLLYGSSRAPSDAEIWECLDTAECQFVRALSAGLDHALTEQGEGLSAGQKQRLSLARALLRRPKVLVLDEATSNLDFDTERRLVDTLARLKGRMTLVAATHRPELLRLADRALRLEGPSAALVQ